jgi:hypothetical protein
MADYKEWFNGVRYVSTLGNCIVYKQTMLENAFAKILPHIIPFINKRRRAAIRRYWRHKYARRAGAALCKLLKKQEQEYKPFTPVQFSDELYEWEVIEKVDNDESKD